MNKLFLPVAGALIIMTGIILASQNKTNRIAFTGDAHIKGTVTDVIWHTPIANAVIRIEDSEFYTDAAGAYEIKNIQPGNYILHVIAKGYTDKTETCSIAEGEQKILDFSLDIAPDVIETPVVVGDLRIPETEAEETTIHLGKSNYKKEKSYAAGTSTVNYYDYAADEPGYDPDFNTEAYNVINENIFKSVVGNPLSTFSIDVDNASYANIRRFINYGQTPPKDAVRIEEMVNYFDYTYAQPKGSDPFSINYEMSECPWNTESRLIMIGLQGKDIDYKEASASNLVFLIDVSGSMDAPNKLPLVVKSLHTLIDNLNEKDKVAVVVYAGAAGLVLPSTPCNQKQTIKDALTHLEAGGSTAGGAGIQLAYDVAVKNLIKEGNNRVILCTDGDFNIGTSSDAEMTRLIEEKRKSGVFITVCGFGMGNYKDSKMESIADNGNGAYYYIDDDKEAKKVFTTDMRGTLFTIAKDVKIQIEFNPAQVKEYRLIGYENRLLNNEDFDNDAKDAGELGAGHRVTALYEIKLNDNAYQPHGLKSNGTTEELKYQTTGIKQQAYDTDEILTLKLRYKNPAEEVSRLIEKPLPNQMVGIELTSENFRFASAVAEFGMLLRSSDLKGDASYEEVIKLANSARGADTNGYRDEFINLVKTYTGFAQK